jgi:hypothetical protein
MSLLRRRPKDAPPRRDRSAEFASVVIERPRARMAQGLDEAQPAVRPALKLTREARTVQAIRDSARGEPCLVRILGCPGDPAMTIWSHAPFGAAGKGMGIKSLDLAGAYCCTYCDAIVDGQRPLPAGVRRDEALLDWFMGHVRSLERLAQKGLL